MDGKFQPQFNLWKEALTSPQIEGHSKRSFARNEPRRFAIPRMLQRIAERGVSGLARKRFVASLKRIATREKLPQSFSVSTAPAQLSPRFGNCLEAVDASWRCERKIGWLGGETVISWELSAKGSSTFSYFLLLYSRTKCTCIAA